MIKFAGCYHGHVDSLLVKAGSGALTLGNPDSAGVPASLAAETIVLPYNDLDAVSETLVSCPDQVAAIIVEPYPANCGLILPLPGYLEGLRKLCTEHGVVLIFDEVMTGFRLGLGGVQQRTGITPDLTAMGKIIGGGLPVGAFGGKEEIMNHLAPLGPVYRAGTLSGNPLAMAAGIASLNYSKTNPYDRLDSMGKEIATGLTGIAQAQAFTAGSSVGSMFSLFSPKTQLPNLRVRSPQNTNFSIPFFTPALTMACIYPPPLVKPVSLVPHMIKRWLIELWRFLRMDFVFWLTSARSVTENISILMEK